MARLRKRKTMLRQGQTRWRGTLILLLGLLLLVLSAQCSRRLSYPPFPLPSEHVATVLDDVGEKDKAIWEWLGKLKVLCIQLGTCKE